MLQPSDHAVPDTHDHLHPAGSDPAWGEDTEFFAEQPEEHAAPERTEEHASPAAEAGAGMLEGHHVEPGPPLSPDHHHHHDEPHPALRDHEHLGGEEHPPEPVFGHSPEAPTAPAPAPEAEEGDSEDVLEETPEFLQDAPEHDRLWFEQKPPRDFDFDE